MNRTFLAGILITLTACSTPLRTVRSQQAEPSASAIYISSDGRFYVTLRHSKKPYAVTLIERESGRVLGTAVSSARLTPDGNQLEGVVHVAYADDLSTIAVHEEFSDASPNPRYILFQRRPQSAFYRTSYIAPPTAQIDTPGEFDFVCPSIQRVTTDTITFGYDGLRQTRTIRISELLKTPSPRSSQEWPSDAYNHYEREHEHAR